MNWSKTAAVQTQGEFRNALRRARELRNALLRAREVEEALGASTKVFLQSETRLADGRRQPVPRTGALTTMRDREPPTWGRWPLPLTARALQDLVGDSESMIHL